MNWFSVFLGLLPQLIAAAAKIEGDVSHKDRKAIVTDSIGALASGVGSVLPAHAAAASAAASVATAAVEGVYNVIGQIQSPSTATAPAS